MPNWGKGYEVGYRAGARKALKLFRADKSKKERDNTLKFLMKQINKADNDNEPSLYAVANKCCGGVDAHDVGC